MEEVESARKELQNEIKELNNKYEIMSKDLERLSNVSSQGYCRISTYARELNLPLNLTIATHLGKIASDVSISWDLHVLSEPHPEFGSIRIYRRSVLKYVFENFYEDVVSQYGSDIDG